MESALTGTSGARVRQKDRGIHIFYFAWVRDQTGMSSETLILPPDVASVGDLVAWLVETSPDYAVLRDERLLCSVDEMMADLDTAVAGAREIAFFPPVTGG
jgi:sulfur-carrier protein